MGESEKIDQSDNFQAQA